MIRMIETTREKLIDMYKKRRVSDTVRSLILDLCNTSYISSELTNFSPSLVSLNTNAWMQLTTDT